MATDEELKYLATIKDGAEYMAYAQKIGFMQRGVSDAKQMIRLFVAGEEPTADRRKPTAEEFDRLYAMTDRAEFMAYSKEIGDPMMAAYTRTSGYSEDEVEEIRSAVFDIVNLTAEGEAMAADFEKQTCRGERWPLRRVIADQRTVVSTNIVGDAIVGVTSQHDG